MVLADVPKLDDGVFSWSQDACHIIHGFTQPDYYGGSGISHDYYAVDDSLTEFLLCWMDGGHEFVKVDDTEFGPLS